MDNIKFTWEGFKNGKFGVICNDNKTLLLFIDKCRENGLTAYFSDNDLNEYNTIDKSLSLGHCIDCFIYVPNSEYVEDLEENEEAPKVMSIIPYNKTNLLKIVIDESFIND